MRILHITAPANFGGLERVVGSLASATAALGHSVAVAAVLTPEAPVPAWATALTDACVEIEVIRIPKRAYWAEQRSVNKLLRRYLPDVVHTHGYRSDIVDGRVALRLGLPVISSVHSLIRLGWRGRLYAWLQIRSLRRMDAVVAVSEALRDELIQAGVRSDTLHQISNGLLASTSANIGRASARSILGLPKHGRVIAWVGRLSAEKGPEVVVEAVNFLADKTAVLCMIGSGVQLTATKALAKQRGVADRVVFTGAVENADAYFSAFDALALSSYSEGTPMVLLEAARAQIPIAATSVGGVPGLLGVEGGCLVPPGDPSALASALNAIFDAPAEAALRARNLLARIEALGVFDGWITEYEQLYRLVSR